jgi:hypothetical protein
VAVRTLELVGAICALAASTACGGTSQVLLGTGPESEGGAPSGAAASGSTSGTGTGGAGDVLDLDVIDDMEDGDERIAMVNGRSGAWSINNDATPAAMQFPAAHGFFVPTRVSPPRGTSQWAVRTFGSGFLGSTQDGNGWAEVQASFISFAATPTDAGPGAGTYDARGYRGVTFLARVGENTQTVVRLTFPDAQTNDRGGQCQQDAGECYNSFGKNMNLGTDWARYTVTFSELAQQTTFGKMFPAVDTEHLYSLNFTFIGAAPFDLWIDDIAFFK